MAQPESMRPFARSVSEGQHLPRSTGLQSNQDFSGECLSFRHALTFGLYDIDGNLSLGDVVISGYAMVKGDEYVKPGLLRFGQEFAIKRPRPSERNDVGTFMPYVVFD